MQYQNNFLLIFFVFFNFSFYIFLISLFYTKHRIEDLLVAPHEHFHPNSFPSYFDSMSGTPPPYVVNYIEVLQQKIEQLQSAVTRNAGFNHS